MSVALFCLGDSSSGRLEWVQNSSTTNARGSWRRHHRRIHGTLEKLPHDAESFKTPQSKSGVAHQPGAHFDSERVIDNRRRLDSRYHRRLVQFLSLVNINWVLMPLSMDCENARCFLHHDHDWNI